jgi:hypothetical protein
LDGERLFSSGAPNRSSDGRGLALAFNGFDIAFHVLLHALKAQRIDHLTMPRMSLKSDGRA